MDGDKLKINDVLGKEIEILNYKISDSKYSDKNCLTIQFLLNNKKHIIFTGSSVLSDQCKLYEKEMPFIATIKKIDKYYTFS